MHPTQLKTIVKYFEDSEFFCSFTNTTPEEAVELFTATDATEDLPFNPFFRSEFKGENWEKLSPIEKLKSHGPLFDKKYASHRNGVQEEEALLFVSKKIAGNEWASFNPLISELDFKASRFPTIGLWVQFISNPYNSLSNSNLVRFMPGFYRQTAKNMRFENELIDYLTNNSQDAGNPHVLNDPWFYAQSTEAASKGKPWYNIHSNMKFGGEISPFYSPLYSNHELSNRVDASNTWNYLDRLSEHAELMPPLHKEIVPNALAYSFLDRDISDILENKTEFRDIFDALAVARTVSSSQSTAPTLSVCILNYNKPTFSALSALAAARNSDDDTEVLVLDNGSAAKDYDLMVRLTSHNKKIRVLKSPRNLYFGEGNNVLFEQAKAELILFLNNDAFVGRNTIRRMKDHLNKNADVTAAGVTFLFPDLKIQEAGGIVSDCGQQIQLRKHSAVEAHISASSESNPEPTQYISSACFMIRKNVLLDVGGYDILYEPLYFEDTDLCKRLTSLSYRIDHIPNEYVIHYENASTRGFLGDQFMKQIGMNREKFRKRWQYQPDGYKPRTYNPVFANSFDENLPTAVVYTPFDIRIGGGERYILSVIAALTDTHNVTLATKDYCSKTRVSFVLADLDVKLPDHSRLQIKLFDEIVGSGPYDLMIAMGNNVVPPVPFIGKRNVYHCQFPFPGHHENLWQTHRLDQVGQIWVNSEYTKGEMVKGLQRVGKDIPVNVTFAPVSQFSTDQFAQKDYSTIKIVNIGRFDPHGHSKRQDIVIEIFKNLSERVKNVELVLIGGLISDKDKQDYFKHLTDKAKGLNVTFLPNASRESLVTTLAESHIYLHACGFDVDIIASPERQEHFGISVVEAMMAGLVPVVFGAGGPQEIIQSSGMGSTYNSIPEAVDIIERLSNQTEAQFLKQSTKVSKNALKFSDKNFASRIQEFLK